jgi:hypothetical protein
MVRSSRYFRGGHPDGIRTGARTLDSPNHPGSVICQGYFSGPAKTFQRDNSVAMEVSNPAAHHRRRDTKGAGNVTLAGIGVIEKIGEDLPVRSVLEPGHDDPVVRRYTSGYKPQEYSVPEAIDLSGDSQDREVIAERPPVHTGPDPECRKVDAGIFLDCGKDPQPRFVVEHVLFRDGPESKVGPEPDSPEQEHLDWLHKGGGYGMDQMADEIGWPHLPSGDRHTCSIDTEQRDVDQLQHAESDKQNPECQGKETIKLV